MHVVLTVNFSPWSLYCGGGQQSTHFLASALSELGHRVTVIYTKPVWEKIAIPSVLSYKAVWAPFWGLRSRSSAPLRPLNAITVARAVQTLCRKERVDVVHCQGEEGALLARLRKHLPPFRLIATPRFPSYPQRLQASPNTAAARAGRWLVPPKFIALGATLRGADYCCPTSRVSAEAVERAYGIATTAQRVVPNGVSPVYLNSARSLNAHGGPLLFFGRVEHSKGIDVFIEALARLGSNARLALIIGRGKAEPWARQRTQDLGMADRVRFLGWQEPATIAQHLAEASIAVLPSREESFGNAIVEAMTAGTPIVTTFHGSIPEVIDTAPVTMVGADAAQIAVAIMQKLQDVQQAEEFAKITQDYARKRYSWNSTACTFAKIYSEGT